MYLSERDDDIERILTAIYAEVLDVRQVDREDDFFRLGGNSLLATRLGARVESEFGVRVPARAFYESPTVASLTPVVAGLRAESATTASTNTDPETRG